MPGVGVGPVLAKRPYVGKLGFLPNHLFCRP
jgi:hypothetical protein